MSENQLNGPLELEESHRNVSNLRRPAEARDATRRINFFRKMMSNLWQPHHAGFQSFISL